MPDDPKSIFDLYQSTLKKITASPIAWADFLRTAGQLYKYSFADQVLIYAQRPAATACAPYDLWVERMKRYVVHGSKGIALIDDAAIPPKLKYVFDVADTRSLQQQNEPPYIWAMSPEYEQDIIADIITDFEIPPEGSDTLAAALLTSAKEITEENLEDYLEDFFSNLQDSPWEELDEHLAVTFYEKTVANSAAWSALHRCGVLKSADIESQDFSHITDCHTPGTITCVGVAAGKVAEKLLRRVELTVRRIERQKPNPQSINNKPKRGISHGADLQNGGQLSIPEFDTDRAGAPDELREVWSAATGLSEERASGDTHYADDAGQTYGTPDGDRQDHLGASGADHGGDGGAGGNNRRTKGQRPARVGQASEQPEEQGRGTGNAGHRLQLDSAVDDTAREVLEDAPDAAFNAVCPPENFRITDTHLGEGGAKAKYAANVTAIKTLQQIEGEMRHATPVEQDILSRYVGWGGIPDSFDSEKEKWSREYTELKALLSGAEYKAARASVLNAHYTSPTVISAIYDGLKNLGFHGGTILEPAMGVGNFFGLLPKSMSSSMLFGVELDNITGRIARCLYPHANITVNGFETTSWASDSFDVAVGNVPFGAYSVSDPRYDRLGFHIHDYFFAKSIDLVRPGGVVAFVTSHYTMDKKTSAVRKYLAQRCELLGAIRLPCTAFLANAGTEVTADILFLQKRERPIGTDAEWIYVTQTLDGLTVNQYFVDNPQMVLGELVKEKRLYGNEDLVCKPFSDAQLADLLADAITNITGAISPREQTAQSEAESSGAIAADPTVRNFSFTEVSGKLYYRSNSAMHPVEANKSAEARIRGMIAIRDVVREVIDTQMAGCDDQMLRSAQSRLDVLYDSYAAEYGLLNSRGNKLAFSDDAGYPLLCALEVLDSDGSLKRKADMFTQRTIRQEVKVTRVDTASEALAVCIGDRAYVDLDYMSSLLGHPGEVDTIIRDLQGVIFRAPDAGDDPLAGWQAADEYLSGNVRHKLEIAQRFAELEPGRYEANVVALQVAQPKNLDAHEIGVRLGVTWIPATDYCQFIFELLDTPWYFHSKINITYAAVNCTWNISGKSLDGKNSVKAYTTYGTGRISAYEIVEASLNLRDVQIFDTIDEKRVLNRKATILAQQKQETVRQAFRDWIWKDPDRRARLTSYYNENFNDTRPRCFDGSHIKFVGMNPEIKLRKHQIDAVARILYGGSTLLAHVVGAGKTWEMVAAAMEGKRLGLCRKSLLVVPSHLTEQWGAEFLQLYPAASILVATKKDFETANRKKFCARIATGDFDAVIIGHSQFEKIPISLERQTEQLQRQISDIENGIRDAKAENGERYTIKQMEYTCKTLEEKLKKLSATEGKDDVVTFEELGVDRLFVDEAHYYKNLFLYTKMRNVAGISQTEAAKSSDLYMKCLYMDTLTARHPGETGRGVIFATGTPISNSMTELYTMMRYLQNEMLKKRGWTFFDAWAAQFGETVTAVELTPEGVGYRQKTRFARFYNLPELMAYWKEATDVQTADMLNLPVPKANYYTVVVPPTQIQRETVRDLGHRAELVRRGDVEPDVDNMLKITSDGRNLALDQRQINRLYPDDPGSKVNACIANVLRVWTESASSLGAQLVFCDLSTPKSRGKEVNILGTNGTVHVPAFSVYNDIKDKLMELGVPSDEVVFIHDANTEAQKAELFANVRAGKVRILLGSTAKMGAGTNAQTKLKALHHLDVPWRPSDIEQREGRILRQGNENPEVDIYRYVTEGTFDAYSWQLIETKQKFIGQIMTSKSPARSCEDVDTTALSYAEVKALAAGNPKIKERMDLEVEVAKLTLLRANYQSEHYRLEDQLLTHFPTKIANVKQNIAAQQADMKTAAENVLPADAFCMEVDGQRYSKKEDAGNALMTLARTIPVGAPTPAGAYRGFKLEVFIDAWSNEYKVCLVGAAPHSAVLGTDPSGNIVRINNLFERFPEVLSGYEQELQTLDQQVTSAKAELSAGWPFDLDWKKKTGRLAELNAELNMELSEPGDTPVDDVGISPHMAEEEQEWEEEL